MFSIVTPAGLLTADLIQQRIQVLSQWLDDLGLHSGQILALSGPTQADYLCLLLAAWQNGLLTLPLNPRLKAEQLHLPASLADFSIGESLICPDKHLNWEQLPPKISPNQLKPWQAPEWNQPLSLILTSGSSGTAKLVQHSWANHFYSAQGSAHTLPLLPSHQWHLALPLFHVGGLAIVIRCLLAGAQISLPGTDLAADLLKHRPSHLSLVATQLHRLLKIETVLPVLQAATAILLGGSAIPEALILEARQQGLPIHTSYGSTEMASQICTTPAAADIETLMSAGHLLPYRELCLSEQGEIWLRGQTLCQGYRQQEGLSSPLNSSGWFASGDMGQYDQGRLIIHGRRDHLIISGGENIQPEAIEAQLLCHSEIEAAIVVGIPDAEFGQRPVAFVRTPLAAASLRNYLKQHLPGYAIPDQFYALPEAQGLKFARQELQQLATKLTNANKT